MEYTNDMLNTYVLPFDVNTDVLLMNNRMFRQVGEARQVDPVGTHYWKSCRWREKTLLII